MTKVCVQTPHPFGDRGPGWTWLDLREGTDDFDVLREVWVEDVYRMRGIAWGKDSVMLDLGAHVGLVSALALQLGCSKTVAIEANVENARLLGANVAPWGSAAEVIHGALVGGYDPDVTLSAASVGTGATARTVLGPDGTVPGYSLATLIHHVAPGEGQLIDFVKVDVEGAEYDAFLSTPPELLGKLGLIHMEWHGPEECPWLPTPRIGELAQHLAHTHACSAFGHPERGGMLFAHRY